MPWSILTNSEAAAVELRAFFQQETPNAVVSAFCEKIPYTRASVEGSIPSRVVRQHGWNRF